MCGSVAYAPRRPHDVCCLLRECPRVRVRYSFALCIVSLAQRRICKQCWRSEDYAFRGASEFAPVARHFPQLSAEDLRTLSGSEPLLHPIYRSGAGLLGLRPTAAAVSVDAVRFGSTVTIKDGVLTVPSDPIIPFIEARKCHRQWFLDFARARVFSQVLEQSIVR